MLQEMQDSFDLYSYSPPNIVKETIFSFLYFLQWHCKERDPYNHENHKCRNYAYTNGFLPFFVVHFVDSFLWFYFFCILQTISWAMMTGFDTSTGGYSFEFGYWLVLSSSLNLEFYGITAKEKDVVLRWRDVLLESCFAFQNRISQ